MYHSLIAFFILIGSLASSSIFAFCGEDYCCSCFDVNVGWRRDSLDWKAKRLHSEYIPGHAKSHIQFNDIDSYTLKANGRWAGSEYYIRGSAEYGLSQNGRAHEHFNIHSDYLYHPISVETSDPIKRRSEFYDFNAAVGYPFAFCCCRLSVVPLIGFSWHRQHIRVKDDEDFYCYSSCYSRSSSCSSFSSPNSYSYLRSRSSKNCSCYSSSTSYCSDHSSCSEFFDYHSSDSFFLSSSNPFRGSPSSDPFGSRSSYSSYNIASALGLGNYHRTSTYRFTWYGVYLGADIAYALDPCWTLYSEIEFHFLDRCNRKRKSWTGVHFVDHYHKNEWAYGYNVLVGLVYQFATCWYANLDVDFNWWKSDQKHDDLHWKKVGAKIGLGYCF